MQKLRFPWAENPEYQRFSHLTFKNGIGQNVVVYASLSQIVMGFYLRLDDTFPQQDLPDWLGIKYQIISQHSSHR